MSKENKTNIWDYRKGFVIGIFFGYLLGPALQAILGGGAVSTLVMCFLCIGAYLAFENQSKKLK